MKKYIPTNESGRSMVEMLGVLAIMGVLSIGAVAGYRWAMDKYEANEILNEVRKRAITSSQARISGHEIDLTEYGDNGRINGKYGVVADNAYNGDDRFFTLTVSDIPQGVCDKVVDVNWQMPAAILLDGVAVDDNTVCGEGNNEMLFAFANDLKSGAVAGGEGEETPDPNKEHCWGHGTWDGTSCACEAGWSGDDCSMTQFCDENGTCYDCDAYVSFLVDAAECSKCDGSRSPRFMSTHRQCWSCSDSYGHEATEAECAKCDKSSTPREMRNGYCILPGYCSEGFLSSSGSCYSCSEPYAYSAIEAECAKCDSTDTPRVLLENGYCALESCGANQFRDTTGSCHSCSDSSGRKATVTECAQCDDSSTPRKMFGDYCGLINCGANQFQSSGGFCFSCSDSYGYPATTTGCAMCDKSSAPRFMGTDGVCRPCSSLWSHIATAAECAKCGKSGTPRFMSPYGACHSCSTSSGYKATEAECAKCDASSTPRYMDGNYCRQCPTSLSSGSLNTQDKCQSCHGRWDAETQKCS